MKAAEQTHQEDLRRVKDFRYMDDDFMKVCLADNYEGVELIINTVLGRSDIKVTELKTQDWLKNLYGRSVILDVHATDSTEKEYDIEIQRSDAGAGAARARYHSSLLDAQILKTGNDTENIPDSYVIFITENDIMNGNQPIYPVDRYVTVGKERVLFEDGSHILYVNGKYRGDDEIGRLMHDFSCTNPDDMKNEALAERARYFKRDERGVAKMCKMMEDMRNEVAKETEKEMARKMIMDKEMPLEKIARYVPLLTIENLREIEAEIMQLA